MADLTPQQLKKFQKDFEKLNTLKRQLGEKPIKIGAIDASVDGLNLLNDSLERAEDLVSNINDGAQGLATSFRNIVSEIKNTNEGYRLGMGSLNKLKDIADKLRLNQKGISELSSADLRSLQRKQRAATEDLKLSKEILLEKEKSSKLTKEEASTLRNITSQLDPKHQSALKQQNELLAIQEKRTRNIERGTGLTGAALKGLQGITGKLGLDGLSQAFEDASDAAKNTVNRLTDGGKKSAGLITKTRALGSAFAVVGKEILRNLVDPLVLGGLAIKGLKASFDFLKAGYEEGKQAAERISDENTSIARSLGLAQGAATKLASRFAGIGPTVAASKQSIEAIYSALGSTEKLSDNTLKTFIKLNTFAGFSADALAKFQTFAKLSSQDAGTMVTNMANVALNSIKVNKLAISQKQLLTDVSNTSATIQIRFAKQPEALIKSVVAAKKLGLEMDQLEDIASSLLNFEDSIAAEMEAELLTGKQLNFEKARELALQGKTAEAAKLLVDQVGGIEEFNKLNVIQQEALAKTLGMNRQGFSEMLLAQEKNVNASGSLVDTQKDGMKAMMSGQSEAENNAERERRNQESQLKYYETAKQLVRDIKDAWIEIRGIIATSITDNLIKPFMAWFNSAGGQTFIKDTLPNAFRDAAKFVKDEIVPGIITAVETLSKFIKENPNIAKAIAGGLAVEAGGRALTGKSVTGTVLSKGSDLVGNLLGKTKFGKFFGIGKNDGQSAAQALWVKITGAASSAVNSVTDMFRSKKPTIKEGTDKLGRKFKYDAATGKRVSMKASTPSGGGGGSFFSKIGKGISGAFKGVVPGISKVAGGVKALGSKVMSAGSKAFKAVKGTLGNAMGSMKSILGGPIAKGFGKALGPIMTLVSGVMDISSITSDARAKLAEGKAVNYGEVGKKIVQAGAYPIANGAMNLIPGVGTAISIADGILGAFGASPIKWITDNLINLVPNSAFKGLGKLAIGEKPKVDKADDFIFQNGKMTKFNKNDLIIGGTKLDQGLKKDSKDKSLDDTQKMIMLLGKIAHAIEKGSIIMLDGQRVGQALSTNARRLQ